MDDKIQAIIEDIELSKKANDIAAIRMRKESDCSSWNIEVMRHIYASGLDKALEICKKHQERE